MQRIRSYAPGCAAVPRTGHRRFVALMATASIFSVGVSPGHAQEVGADSQEETVSSAPSDEAILVTGTRIVRDGFESPTPLAVVSVEEIKSSADSNIQSLLATMPAFMGSAGTRGNVSNGSSGGGGVNSLNLRGLGTDRTLILMDGHRVTPSLATGIIDVNTVPQALIARVDVVTGGASATYGSDAVAGVVNFILDRNFTGVRGEISGGVTNYGDGENYKISLAGGAEFANGRGHILVAGEHAYDYGIGRDSRDWVRRGRYQIANPNYTADNGQPRYLALDGSGYSSASQGGVIVSGPLMGIAFGEGGVPYQFGYGDIRDSNYMQGGDWQQTNNRRTNAIAPVESRQMAFARGSFEVVEALNLYAQFSYVKAKTHNEVANIYMPGTGGPLVQVDNAYLPESVRDLMIDNGLTSIRLGHLNQDWGITEQFTNRDSTTYQVGADGKIGGWRYDIYFQQGTTNNYVTFPNNVNLGNYARAADAVVDPATGLIVCRSTLSDPTNGCQPWNVLGVGVNDRGGSGYAYILDPSWSDLKLKQTVVSGVVSGEPFSTWAGPVSLAISAEYRKDQAETTVDPTSLVAGHRYGNYGEINGSTNVKEVALETVIPLADGAAFADTLELNGAVRYTDYNRAGKVTTWKVGGIYAPIPDIKFRATVSRDIRAPNLSETFLPQATARRSVLDPFTGDVTTFNQVSQGNLNLSPEVADAFNVGVVVAPSFLPGFTASVDYWDINIKDAITLISAEDTLRLCFEGTVPELCDSITRGPDGLIDAIISQGVNIASEKVRGIDFEFSYRHDLADLGLPGRVELHGNLTKYLERTVDNGLGTDIPVDTVGENGGGTPPNWAMRTTLAYSVDAFRIALTARGLSDGVEYADYIECQTDCPSTPTGSTARTINDNFLPGRLWLDLAISYDFNIGDARTLTTFFNVRNLTNEDPIQSVRSLPFGNAGNSNKYDVDGTVFRAGVRFRL